MTAVLDAAFAAYEETLVLGGFTYPSAPPTGYMVSLSRANGGNPEIVSADDFKPTFVEDYILKASIWLEHAGQYFVGGRHNQEDGNVYLDISRYFGDLETARIHAQLNDQIAIWDLDAAKEIPTGGTGQS